MAAQRQFLAVAASSKKPDDATLQKLFAPTNELISKISALKDNRSKVANNLATVAEGISALGWVLVVCIAKRRGENTTRIVFNA